jgi:hypothetical protein
MSEFQSPQPRWQQPSEQTPYPQYQQPPIPPMSQLPKKGWRPSLWTALVVAVVLIATVIAYSQVSINTSPDTQATATVRVQQTTNYKADTKDN